MHVYVCMIGNLRNSVYVCVECERMLSTILFFFRTAHREFVCSSFQFHYSWYFFNNDIYLYIICHSTQSTNIFWMDDSTVRSLHACWSQFFLFLLFFAQHTLFCCFSLTVSVYSTTSCHILTSHLLQSAAYPSIQSIDLTNFLLLSVSHRLRFFFFLEFSYWKLFFFF